MKIWTALLLVAVVVVTVASSSVDQQEWEKFKTDFNKKYDNAQEEEYRKGIYGKCKEMIEKHNEKYKKGEVSHFLGVNQFCDLTQEEFKNRYLMKPKKDAQTTN